MADIQTQIATARNAGYDYAAIAQHLDTMPEYSGKVSTALKAGYAPTEIIKFLATPRTLLSQIPGAENAPAPKAETKPSLYQRILGAAEVPIGMGLSAIAAPIAGAAGILSNLTSGQFGTQEGLRIADETRQRVQHQLYHPITETGAQNLQAVGQVLEPLTGVPLPIMNALAQGVAAPLRMGTNALRGEAQLVGGAIADKVKARAAVTQAANEAASYANAPQIEAAQTAQKLGLALNPSISNPTAATRAISALGGKEATTKLAQGNNQRLINVVKQDLGDTTPGKIAPGAFEDALNIADAPAEVVRKIPTLTVSDTAVQALNRIPKPPTIGGKAEAAEVASLVDHAITELNAGRSGAQVLDDIRKMRTAAQAVFKANDKGTSAPDSVATAGAQARMQIAKVLEDIIDANAPANVLPELRAGRVRSAQIFDHERAFDPATGQIDPQIYAKLLRERKGAMTGLPADIGRVAANYPEVMQIIPTEGFLAPRTYRGTLAGAAGAAMGYAAGGPIGAAVGGGLGSLGGAFAGNLAARQIASPAFQAKYAVPQDFRRPAPDTGLSLAPGYEPSPFRPREAPPTQAGNQFTLGEYQPPQAPAQLQMPSIDYPPGGLNSRPYTVDQLIRRQQEAAEAAQRATEAATRVPTGRGMALEMGPEGKLRPASQGMVGATPDTIMSAGYPLSSAVEKVSSGRNFALTAEEKIAWDKTRVDLADAVPGFNKLSDKAILGKMQDRAWVADAVQKARDQAKGFAEIGRRSDDRIVSARADAESARMMNLAESLEESLRARPVEMKNRSQGPKTRAARRNELAPEDAVIVTPRNALRP